MNKVPSEVNSVLYNTQSVTTKEMLRSKTNQIFPTELSSPSKSNKRLMSIRLTLALPTQSAEINNKTYPQTLEQGFSFISRLFFFHVFQYCRGLRKLGTSIAYDNMPRLSAREKIDVIIQDGCQFIDSRDSLAWTDLVTLIFLRKLLPTVVLSAACFLLDNIAKSLTSVMLNSVLQNIAASDNFAALRDISIIVLLNLIGTMAKNYGYYFGMLFSTKARMLLINVVYYKLTNLGYNSIREANPGKIINLVSSDIQQLEKYLITILQIFALPFTILFAAVIVWNRFNGIKGLLGLSIIFLSYPIIVIVSNFTKNYMPESQKHGDARVKSLNELIDSIRLVKMYALEERYNQIITATRIRESFSLLLFHIGVQLQRTISQSSHFWGSVVFFLILHYATSSQQLNVATMISTIQLFSYLKVSCVAMLQQALVTYLLIKTSLIRVSTILNIKNNSMTKLKSDTSKQIDDALLQVTETAEVWTQENALNSPMFSPTNKINLFQLNSSPRQKNVAVIQLNNFSCYWQSGKSANAILKNITLFIRTGEFWILYGHVGCGKTTLLQSILQEIPLYSGQAYIDDSLKIAYVEQEPFLFPDTIRNNILFGRPYDPALYEKAVQASCLWTDIINMAAKDLTEVQENGTNLSGGQRARVALARALYSLSDVYLLDDPLSAVDASVARTIYQDAIQKFIREVQPQWNPRRPEPIILLVTNQIRLALNCDKIGVLDQGELICQGRYDQVEYFKNNNLEQDEADQSDESRSCGDSNSDPSDGLTSSLNEESFYKEDKQLDEQKLKIGWSSYKRYFSYLGIPYMVTIVTFNVAYVVVYQIFLKIISEFDYYQQQGQQELAYTYIGILCLGGFVLNFLKYCLTALGSNRAILTLHTEMVRKLIILPVHYFDKQPSGRILSRFSVDTAAVDGQTLYVLIDVTETLITILVSLVTIGILQPYFLFIVFLLFIANVYLVSLYKSLIIEIKEVELSKRSPVFDFLKKTIAGITQIKIYHQQEYFRYRFLKVNNKFYKCILTFYHVARTFEVNIDIIGFFVQTAGLFMILTFNFEDKSGFAQSILLLLTFSDNFQWGLRQLINFQTLMNSYQRMFNLIDENAEPQLSNWAPVFPKTGRVEFRQISVKYKQSAPLVLKQISFIIGDGERVAIVGRSGSGKSSIVQTLFRMVAFESQDTPSASYIKIGDQDITQIPLKQLRSSLGIITQTTFIYAGTVRQNLDPYNEHTDQVIWQALMDCCLYESIQDLEQGLDTNILDDSLGLSLGQQQLLGLARLILQNKKIIVLDEATANLDYQTDELIQEIIKQKFKGSTIITIAHRLNTIADYDKVMVMREGILVEFDTPFNLLAFEKNDRTIEKDTEFARLVIKSGLKNSQIIFRVAKDKQYPPTQEEED